MVSMDAIWLFSLLTQLLPATSWLPTTSTLHPYRSACDIGYTSKYHLRKMAGNLASYPFNSWCVYRLGIAIESWLIACRYLFSFPRYNTSKIIKIVISDYFQLCLESGFLKSSHIWSKHICRYITVYNMQLATYGTAIMQCCTRMLE